MVSEHPLAHIHEEILVPRGHGIERADFMQALGEQNAWAGGFGVHANSLLLITDIV
jgi:hypothetical protein